MKIVNVLQGIVPIDLSQKSTTNVPMRTPSVHMQSTPKTAMSSGKSSWADIVEEEIINGTVNGKTQTLGPNFPNSWSKVIGMPIPIEGYDLTINACSSSKTNVKITLDDVQDEIDYGSTTVIFYILGSNPL